MSHKTFIIFIFLFRLASRCEDCAWRDLAARDTLDVFLSGAIVGNLVHRIEYREKEKIVVDHTDMWIDADMSGRDGAGNRIDVRETRTFDDSGRLISASQELIGQSGNNTWFLKKSSGGFKLSSTIGGQTTGKNIGSVPDNLLSDCRMRSAIRNNTMQCGMRWQDTVFELMSGRPIVTSTLCTGVDSVQRRWTFELTDDLSGRKEKCVLGIDGSIIERSIEGIYTAKRRSSGNAGISTRPFAAHPTVTELFAVPADRACGEGEAPAIVFVDSSLSIDSSAQFLYGKHGNTWHLRTFPGRCRPHGESTLPNELIKWLQPGMAVQSDHPKIMELAQKIRGKKTVPCTIIAEFNHYVFSHVKKRNTAVFSNALETLNAGYGDCGEHAALLTALLRAVGIPARVALGLLYVDARREYLYHAQVLAYAGEWLLADPTWDVFPVSGGFVPLIIDDTGAQAMQLSRLIGRFHIEYVKK
jgi:hypothetical protein